MYSAAFAYRPRLIFLFQMVTDAVVRAELQGPGAKNPENQYCSRIIKGGARRKTALYGINTCKTCSFSDFFVAHTPRVQSNLRASRRERNQLQETSRIPANDFLFTGSLYNRNATAQSNDSTSTVLCDPTARIQRPSQCAHHASCIMSAMDSWLLGSLQPKRRTPIAFFVLH